MAVLAVGFVKSIRTNGSDTSLFDLQIRYSPVGGAEYDDNADEFWEQGFSAGGLAAGLASTIANSIKDHANSRFGIEFGLLDTARVLLGIV